MHLLNTGIIPWFSGDACVRVTEISLEAATRLLQTEAILVSHIGHDGTARFLTALAEREVVVDRSPWNGEGLALACQLHSRQAAGVELTVAEMLAAGVGWRLIEITRD